MRREFKPCPRVLLIIMVFLTGASFSFSQQWLWGVQGNAESQGFSASAESGGNIYTAGHFSNPTIGFGPVVLTNSGSRDIFLIKYDNSGNVVWGKQAGGTGIDVATSVAADASGNVYVTGYFNSPTLSFGSITLTNTGSYDIFLAKYDAQGNLLWAVSPKGNTDDRGASVSVSSGGDAVITGYYMSAQLDFGPAQLTNTTTNGLAMDVFVARFSPTGSFIWARSAGDLYNDAGCGVSVDGGGNVFVSGYFSITKISFGSTNLNCAGSYDAFIAKYDANGTFLWARRAGGANNEIGYSVSADPTGNVFMTGYFESPSVAFGSVTLMGTSGNTPADVFVVKYSSTGTVQWARGAGSAQNDMGFSVSADGSGNAFVIGFFGGSSISFGSTSVSFPAGTGSPTFIAKYSGGGQVICASHLGAGGQINNGVSADKTGYAYVSAGFQSGTLSVGPNTLNLVGGIGATNAFLAKFTCNVTVLTVGASATNPLCNGQCTGTATAYPANGKPPYTYSWSTVPGQTTSTATGLCAGSYTVTVTDAAQATASAPVTVFQPAPFTLSTTVNNVCGNALSGTASVTPTGGTATYTYSWNMGNTTTSVSGLAAGNYIVSAVDSKGCTAIDTAIIGSYPAPVAAISGNTSFCTGNTVQLTGSGGTSYSWNNGATTASISSSSSSSYTLVVTDANGCMDTAFVQTTALPVPTVAISGIQAITAGDSTVLTASGGPPYLWSNGSTDSSIIVSPESSQQYCVTVTNAFNCTHQTCVTVTVEPLTCPEPYLPNAFSPNGDGDNDSLQIYTENMDCVEDLYMVIFDRWGEKLFHTRDKYFRWDGSGAAGLIKGPEHDIVLSYFLRIGLTNGEKILKRGNVTVLR